MVELLTTLISWLATTGTNELLVAIATKNAIALGGIWAGITILARVISKRTKTTLDDEIVSEVKSKLEKK